MEKGKKNKCGQADGFLSNASRQERTSFHFCCLHTLSLGLLVPEEECSIVWAFASYEQCSPALDQESNWKSGSHPGRIKRLDWCFCNSAVLNYVGLILAQALPGSRFYNLTACKLQWSLIVLDWFMCQFMSSHYGHVNVGLLLARTEPHAHLELRVRLFPLSHMVWVWRGAVFQREPGEIMDASWRQRMPTMKG